MEDGLYLAHGIVEDTDGVVHMLRGDFSSIEAARRFMGMTQQEIASDLDIAISTWRRWENSDKIPRWLRLCIVGKLQEFKALAPPTQSRIRLHLHSPGRGQLDDGIFHAVYVYPQTAPTHLTKAQRVANAGGLFWAFYEMDREWYIVHLDRDGIPMQLQVDSLPSWLISMPDWLRQHLPAADRAKLADRYQRPDYASGVSSRI